jgi:proline iminopeptidase
MAEDRHLPVEPYDSGVLEVGNGYSLNWEAIGSLTGVPAV